MAGVHIKDFVFLAPTGEGGGASKQGEAFFNNLDWDVINGWVSKYQIPLK